MYFHTTTLARCVRFPIFRRRFEMLKDINTRCMSLISEDKIVRSPAASINYPKGNLVDTIFKHVDKYWMKTAIECPTTGRKTSYEELVIQSRRWSGYLKRLGISKGDIITTMSPNAIQLIPILIGAAAMGVVINPLNYRFTHDEIERLLKIIDSKAIIFSPVAEEILLKSLKGRSKDYILMSLGKSSKVECLNVDDILYGDESIEQILPLKLTGEELLYIPFSSGTTGPPKRVSVTHNCATTGVYQLSNPYHDVNRQTTDQFQHVQMSMMPVFHLGGYITNIMVGAFNGYKVIPVTVKDINYLIQCIKKYKVSALSIVPSILNLMCNNPLCNEETMSSIEDVMCGAAPVHNTTVHLFKQKVKRKVDFFEAYGMSELLAVNSTPRRNQVIGSCGPLLSDITAKVISTDTGESLGPNQQGEICVRTPAVMKGYINNPEATNEFLRGGWAHTGDVGYYDNDGYFYITDRTKDLLKVEGMQVSPSEIEDVLQKHPAVEECSVIGVPDENQDEVPMAFVVRKQEVTEAELIKFLENKLASHKQLRGGVRFADSLPKSEMGKILRKEVRKMV